MQAYLSSFPSKEYVRAKFAFFDPSKNASSIASSLALNLGVNLVRLPDTYEPDYDIDDEDDDPLVGEMMYIFTATTWAEGSYVYYSDSRYTKYFRRLGYVIIGAISEPTIFVLSPSGSGKSYEVTHDTLRKLVDGDDIISNSMGWPVEAMWWEKDLKELHLVPSGMATTPNKFPHQVHYMLKKWADNHPGYVIRFAGIMGHAEDFPEGRTFIHVPSYRDHLERMKSREATIGKGRQPVHFGAELKSSRDKWKNVYGKFPIYSNSLRCEGNRDVDYVIDTKDWVKEVTSGNLLAYNFQQFKPSDAYLFRNSLHRISSLGYIASIFSLDRYYSLGETPQRVELGINMRKRFRGMNMSVPRLWTLESIPEGVELAEVTPNHNVSTGQYKLLLADIAAIGYFTAWRKVLYLGAAPGEHLNKIIQFVDEWILVDPRPIAVRYQTSKANVMILQEVATEELVQKYAKGALVIMDIRRDPVEGLTWEQVVEEDTLLMSKLADVALEYGAIGISMKYRPIIGKDAVLDLNAKYMIEAYSAGRSYEGRLLFSRRWHECNMVSYPNKQFRQLRSIRKIVGEDVIKDGELSQLIDFGNYLTIFGIPDCIALYTLCNFNNPRDAYLRVVASNDLLIFNLPNIHYTGYDRTELGPVWNHIQRDWTYNPNVVIWILFRNDAHYSWYVYRDFLAKRLLTGDGYGRYGVADMSHRGERIYPVNPNAREAWDWAWFVKEDRDTIPQSWLESQTIWVKMVSNKIKRTLNLSQDSVYHFRRYVCMMLYGAEFKPVKSNRITGLLRGKPISVAGHLVDILLACSLGVIDIIRYWKTVMYHIKYVAKLPKDVELMEKHTQGVYWHSYDDWFSAIAVYLVMCKVLKIKVCYVEVLISASMLNKIVKLYSVLKHVYSIDVKTWLGGPALRTLEMRTLATN
jgi:hypothetical protein